MSRKGRFLLFVLVLAGLSAYLYAHRQYADRSQVPEGATPVTAATPDATTTSSAGAVAAFLLARDDAQSQALAQYQAVIDDKAATPAARAAAGQAYAALVRAMEAEKEAQNLLAMKGFRSTAVLVEGAHALVVVGTGGAPLTQPNAVKVAYTVAEVTGLPLTAVHVVPR
jgi:hypothetical protein